MIRILELSFIIIFNILLCWQILIPWIFDRPILPWWQNRKIKKSQIQLLQRKKEAEEKVRLAQLEAEAVELEVDAEITRSSILDEVVTKNNHGNS